MKEPPDTKVGILEHLVGTRKANRMRDLWRPLLNPKCPWGLKIDRCGKDATIRHRVSEDFEWRYSCNKHGFHPDCLDVLGRVDRPGNSESDWEWLDRSDKVPPIYPMPDALDERKDFEGKNIKSNNK